MVILTGMFRQTTLACPICGAPNMDCQRERPTPVVRDTDFTRRSDGTIVMDARHRFRLESSRWRSAMDVLVQVGDKKLERRYAAGDLIPLVEAMSQHQVLPADLTEQDKATLREHLAAGKITREEVKEMLSAAMELAAKKKKVPKNRMLGEGSVTQKAMTDAEELLEGVE